MFVLHRGSLMRERALAKGGFGRSRTFRNMILSREIFWNWNFPKRILKHAEEETLTTWKLENKKAIFWTVRFTFVLQFDPLKFREFSEVQRVTRLFWVISRRLRCWWFSANRPVFNVLPKRTLFQINPVLTASLIP